MAYEYDRVEREDGGGSFLMGLLAGTVLGAGLGMLFAPKAGVEVRKQLSEQATRLRSTATDTIQQASEKLSQASQQASEKLSHVSQQASEKIGQASDKVEPDGGPRARRLRPRQDGHHSDGMTEQTATRIANVALGAAALGAAFIIVRTPPLRRMAHWLGDDGADGRDPRVAGAGGAARVGSERRAARYDGRVMAQAARRVPRGRRVLARARVEIRLTALAIWRGITGVYNSDDLTFASSIAYYSLLSLFPFFLLALSIVALVTDSQADRDAVAGFVFRYFPRQFDFVTVQLAALQRAQLRLGVAGSVLLVWAAMGVFGAITSAVNHAWGVEKQPSYLKHKLISFVMLVVAALLLLLGLLTVSAINVVEARWFAGVIAATPRLLVLQGLAVRWATTVLFILVVGLVFYFVPNAKVRFRDVWVGAVLTGLLWRGALALFSGYVRDLSRFNMLHGSIAAVVVFLLWVYVSAVILLYGVEVTAAYARLRRHRR